MNTIKNSNIEIRNSKQNPIPKNPNSKHYDLEARTLQFAKDVRFFANRLPKTFINVDDLKQLIRSSGSVAANYIEANDSLSKKDFIMRIKIARKEAKESTLWLKLINVDDQQTAQIKESLLSEATQLMKILGSILHKSQN